MHIEEYLFRAQLTQKKLAELLGIPPPVLCRILKGKQKFPAKLALKIEELTKGIVSRDECIYPEKYNDWRIKDEEDN